MFALNESKCKTNLKLAIERMKLVDKKKSENATKARKEIAGYIQSNKIDRARIKVEHLIREDYMMEAIDLVEMFCDLLLARFSIFAKMKQVDVAVEEAVASIIWAGPRMESEIPELRKVITLLTSKLGKTYIEQCTSNSMQIVNDKLIQRMSIEAPSRVLVERYLVEIATSHGVSFEPDPVVMHQDRQWNLGQQYLINFDRDEIKTPLSSNEDIGFSQMQQPPPFIPLYPSAPTLSDSPLPKHDKKMEPKNDPDYVAASDWYFSDKTTIMPVISQPEMKLPDVPDTEVTSKSDFDFEDLNKRFEELKKRK